MKSSTSCFPIASVMAENLTGRSSIPKTAGRKARWISLGQLGRFGGGRFQGGTLNGITSKLDYLNGLGVTTLWVGPTFKQRTHFDSYHGYAIQDGNVHVNISTAPFR
jgi:glycosidase